MLLMGSAWSLFRDFESHLRIVLGLDEDEIQILLKQKISDSVTSRYPQTITQLKIF